jgi:tRNA A37 threonylcarbamoyladenosine dehydratase
MCRHSLRPQTMSLRNQGRVPETLTEKKIALLGSGALGSCIADLLVKAGVGEIHLFDKDIM